MTRLYTNSISFLKLFNNSGISVLVVFFCSIAFYLLNISHTPDFDELYHILAARGVQETGTPSIAEGVYERVYFLTWVISKLYDQFGESLLISRLPSLVPVTITNCIIFWWLSCVSNKTSAWIATLLFATSPYAFDVAQYTRFYGLQTLCFLIGAIGIYYSIHSAHISKKLISLIASLIFTYIAIYFQKTSLMGVAAITVWLSIALSVHVVKSTTIEAHLKYVMFFIAGLLLTLIFLVLFKIGFIGAIWDEYRTVQPFNIGTANEFWYYHKWFSIYYPSLWPIFGLICIAAIACFPKPAYFCITVFTVSFLFNSFAPNKDLLYLMYAQPFMFMVVGMSIESIKDPILLWTKKSYKSIHSELPFINLVSKSITLCAFFLSAAFLITANSASIRTISQIAGITVPPELPDTNWEKARPILTPLIATADIVVTMTELEMLYYFDDYDLLYSESRLAEIPDGKEFSLDFRTGRPVIGSIDSLQNIFNCYDTGVFLSTKRRWKKPNLMTDDVADLITSNTQPIELPKVSRVVAYKWSSTNNTSIANRVCEQISSIVNR